MKKSILLIVCLFFIATGIIYAQANLLLGMTANGGAHNAGIIFKINYDGSGFKVLHSFDSATGRNPYGSLIRANNGLFYGTANSGGTKNGGVIFSFDTAANKYINVHNFSTTDGKGCNAQNTLLQASDGKLYGMTGAGGTNNLGVLFNFNPANNKYKKLIDFNGTNGASPYHNSLIQASNGLLYGLTAGGGLYYFGVFFSYNLINNTYNSYDMPNQKDLYLASHYPNGRLIESSDGFLRGTTVSSYYQCYTTNSPLEGTLMAFNPGNNATNVGYDFGYSLCYEDAIANGAYPYGSLIEQSTGVFYGMNSGDAAWSLPPNIFKFDSNGALTELFDFNNSVSNGSLPYGSFIIGNDGNLYGMTWSGGANNFGVIFSFNPANNSYLKIHDFDGAHGANPYSDLITCSLPNRPNLIVGNSLFCPDSIQTYTVEPPAFGATSYTWTVPAGSSIQGSKTGVSIKVLMGNVTGSITVKAKNACGISPSSSKLLAILPGTPGIITGNFLFCPGSTQTYTIAPVAGATSYKWTVPAGSSIQGAKTGVSIKVLMGNKTGSIKVWAKSACAISPDSSSKLLAIHCTTFTEAQAHSAFMADISPNPTTGNITLQFNSSAKDNYSVKVIDIVGKMVMNIKGTSEPGLNTIHLDLSKFAKGIYIVALDEGYNKKLITKIVLQ